MPAVAGGGALPRTFRPVWGRRVPLVLGAGLLVTFASLAVLLPQEGTLAFGLADRVGLVALGLAAAYLLHRLADVRLVAEEGGLTVVNYVRRRRLDWAEVLGVRLPPGAPWLVLDLSDGTALPVMGVQGSDGEAARAQAREVARLVHRRTRTARDD